MNRLITSGLFETDLEAISQPAALAPTAIQATKQPLYLSQRDAMLSTSYEWSQMIYAKDPSRQQRREMPLCSI